MWCVYCVYSGVCFFLFLLFYLVFLFYVYFWMVNATQDSNVIFKYIQVVCEVGQYVQVELICRENDYDLEEVYVTRMNGTTKIVDALLDLNAPEDQIHNLINSVRPPQCTVGELVGEAEKRVRLPSISN